MWKSLLATKEYSVSRRGVVVEEIPDTAQFLISLLLVPSWSIHRPEHSSIHLGALEHSPSWSIRWSACAFACNRLGVSPSCRRGKRCSAYLLKQYIRVSLDVSYQYAGKIVKFNNGSERNKN